MTCITKGCDNENEKHKFAGSLCTSCYKMITTGEVGGGYTFIHDIENKRRIYKEVFIELAGFVVKARNAEGK